MILIWNVGVAAIIVQVKRALARLAASCTGTGPASECALADALEMEEMEQ